MAIDLYRLCQKRPLALVFLVRHPGQPLLQRLHEPPQVGQPLTQQLHPFLVLRLMIDPGLNDLDLLPRGRLGGIDRDPSAG